MKDKPTANYSHLTHPIPPTYNADSEVLILGSFPSVKSREMGYFYGHPQNRYWKILAAIFKEDTPIAIDERRHFLLRHHIAAWDVIASCEIVGSSDASIKNAVPNDLSVILDSAPIRRIAANGKKAHSLYQKYIEPQTGIPAICLPSSSPANAAWSLDRLTAEWKTLLFDEIHSQPRSAADPAPSAAS